MFANSRNCPRLGVLVLHLCFTFLTFEAFDFSFAFVENLDESLALPDGQFHHYVIYTSASECGGPVCAKSKTSCSLPCGDYIPFDEDNNMKLTLNNLNGSSIHGVSCTIGAQVAVGQRPATCSSPHSLAGKDGFLLVLTVTDMNNVTLEMTATSMNFIAGAFDGRRQNNQERKYIVLSHETPWEFRRNTKWNFAGLSTGYERKGNLWCSPQVIPPEAYQRRQRYLRFEISKLGFSLGSPHARQNYLEQNMFRHDDYNDIFNKTTDDDADDIPQNIEVPQDVTGFTPTIVGPDETFIQNVSVYLVGVKINYFQIRAPVHRLPGMDKIYKEYMLLLQVDTGWLLLYMPPYLLRHMKHQVTMVSAWRPIGPNEYNSSLAFCIVPGAGIQFICSLDTCNRVLNTLTFAKGPGWGMKSYTGLTIMVFPSVGHLAVYPLKGEKYCFMMLEGAGAWFTFFHYTKRFYQNSTGVFGAALCFVSFFSCFLCHRVFLQKRKQRLFNKQQVILNSEDNLQDGSRIFNPFWIPSATAESGNDKMVVTPNPKVLQQRQSKHLNRLQCLTPDESMDAEVGEEYDENAEEGDEISEEGGARSGHGRSVMKGRGSGLTPPDSGTSDPPIDENYSREKPSMLEGLLARIGL